MSLDDPKTLGRFQIVGEIGRGTMGVVYRAVDPVLGRTVALKTVNLRLCAGDPDRGSFEARFLTEARAAALLAHPAIVTVHDLGRDAESETLYIALEHLEGRTLAEAVREDGPLPWRRALEVAARIAGALDHAHQRGIVHRDVKPANIMILPGGEPKLMDFGIAKVDAADLTAPGDFLGTPSYMSPEQASGAPIDGRSDVFSLGTVLYFALTGRRPFEAPSVPGVMARVVNDPAGPTDAPGLPADGEYLLDRCLAKRPARRYARARHLEEDAEDVLAGRPPRHRGEPLPSADDTGPAIASSGDRLVRWVERLGWRSLVAVGAVLIVIAAAALTRQPPAATAPVAHPSAAPAPLSAPARLEVSFRHPFRTAKVRVWVDGVLRVEEEVAGRVTRDLLAVKVRRASYEAALDVAPGERVVRVQVDDGRGFRESRRIRGAFPSAQTRRLEASVGGVVRKDLDLVWGR